MDISIWIAKLLGPPLAVSAIPMIVTPGAITRMAQDFLKNRPLIFIAGILIFLAGLVIVNTHNIWRADWTLIITLIGWALVAGGTVRIVSPRLVARAGVAMLGNMTAVRIAGALWAAAGLYLAAKGYSLI